jgi:hypothetical protein
MVASPSAAGSIDFECKTLVYGQNLAESSCGYQFLHSELGVSQILGQAGNPTFQPSASNK